MREKRDKNLISQYLKGEEKALEILIKRYLKPIYGFSYKYAGNIQEAEDITQEVFVKVWRNIRKFNPQKSPAPYRTEGSGSGFKTWIFSIAKNTAIDFLKKKKAIQFSDFENEKGENVLAERFVDSSPLPNEILERKDMMGALAKAINKLLPKYRKVLFLRHNDDLTFRQIAESLNEPLNTVKSRHRRAATALKKIFSKY
jgi:RNA polymerase sigma-70 factor (ECF subfamily)